MGFLNGNTVNVRQRTAEMLARKKLATASVLSDNSTPLDLLPGNGRNYLPVAGGGWAPTSFYTLVNAANSLPGLAPDTSTPPPFDSKRADYKNGRAVNAAGQYIDEGQNVQETRYAQNKDVINQRQIGPETPIQSRLKQLATTRAKIQMTRGI